MTSPQNIESLIAQDVTDLLFADVRRTSKAPTLAAFAHAFGAACEGRQFIPDDAAYHRILFDVVRVIGERRQAADRLNTAIVKSTADLLDLRRTMR